jgi:FlaA1/EpsC-like NDP-sugar epimerase
LSIKQVVIALDEVGVMEIRRIMDICSAIPVRRTIVPSLNEIATGPSLCQSNSRVQIEDLLGREPVILDDKNLHDFLTRTHGHGHRCGWLDRFRARPTDH